MMICSELLVLKTWTRNLSMMICDSFVVCSHDFYFEMTELEKYSLALAVYCYQQKAREREVFETVL